MRARLGDPALADEAGALTGYEIHAGRAEAALRCCNPAPRWPTAPDGAGAADGRIWGTHLHGLLHNDDFRRAWLRSLGWQRGRPAAGPTANGRRRHTTGWPTHWKPRWTKADSMRIIGL